MPMSKTRVVDWTPALEATKALTVKQPLAWLIVSGFKDVENRSRRTHHRGPLLIHAGLDKSLFNVDEAEYIKEKYGVDIPDELDFGAVVGVVDVVDCVETSKSKWHMPGHFGWVLANPRQLESRGCKGALGTFLPVFEV
jgi:hypothetical protein